jgi:hypothetical protein
MKDFALNVWEDLRAKRLWPVALVLALALVAVPILLLKGRPEQARRDLDLSPPSAARLPIVNPDDSAMSGSSRLDALSSKNPFKPHLDKLAAMGDPASPDSSASATESAPSSSSGASGAEGATGTGSAGGASGGSGDTGAASGGGSSGGSGGGGGSGGDSGGGTAPSSGSGGGGSSGGGSSQPATRYFTYETVVHFGLPGSTEYDQSRRLRGVTPLTGRAERVVVVYLGQSAAGESVFLVNQDFKVGRGDGNCRPSPKDCAFVYLKPESGRNDVVIRRKGAEGDEYRLHLVEVHRVFVDPDGTGTTSAAGESRRKRHRRGLRPFDFRIPLLAGRRG